MPMAVVASVATQVQLSVPKVSPQTRVCAVRTDLS